MVIVGGTKVVDDLAAKLQPKLEEGFKIDLVPLPDDVGVREVNALREELVEAHEAEGIAVPECLKAGVVKEADPFKLIGSSGERKTEEVKGDDKVEPATD